MKVWHPPGEENEPFSYYSDDGDGFGAILWAAIFVAVFFIIALIVVIPKL